MSEPASAPATPAASASSDPSLAVGGEPAGSATMRPGFVFFGSVAATVLLLDVVSKAWAELELSRRSLKEGALVIFEDHLSLTLAYNRGGAWGLLQDASEMVRKPFFFGVSIAAIFFIVSLYSRIADNQKALRWGLPLVLGGALGNLADRVVRGSVVDFIDYRASWVEGMNRTIAHVVKGWNITSHWPTFNVADISICVGVGLMVVDMITSRRPTPLAGAPIAPRPSATPEQ
jgi:signal peptidase II